MPSSSPINRRATSSTATAVIARARNIAAASVKTAFEGLAEPFRIAVLLVDVEGLTYREAADAIDVPIGTVMSRLNRGRRLMRLALVNEAAAYGIGTEERKRG